MTHIDGVAQNIQLVSKSTLIVLSTYSRIPVSSRSFAHHTASRILLDAKVNNGTSYFNKGPKRNPKEPKNQKSKEQKKMPKKKNPRVDLNPSYRIPAKRHRAIPSDH